ncbi:hypothetical protein D1872_221860 [compost metagenome]
MFGNIRKSVSTYFILRLLPARIPMGRPLQSTKRNFICRLIRNHIYRKANFQQLVRFIPAHMRLEINSPLMMIKDHILCHFRLMDSPSEAQHILCFPLEYYLFFQQLGFSCYLFLIAVIQVPCIPQRRTVMEKIKTVCPFPLLQNFTVCRFIQQTNHFAPFVKLHLIKCCLPDIP